MVWETDIIDGVPCGAASESCDEPRTRDCPLFIVSSDVPFGLTKISTRTQPRDFFSSPRRVVLFFKRERRWIIRKKHRTTVLHDDNVAALDPSIGRGVDVSRRRVRGNVVGSRAQLSHDYYTDHDDDLRILCNVEPGAFSLHAG